jgi:ABC-2 type transport system ATP-binding protein
MNIIECAKLSKEFKCLEPSGGSSTSGQWVHYIAGLLGRSNSNDPFAPKKGILLAVDRVDLEVQGGELFGFLGPNGAGKTTLIKMLATVLLPTSGSARVAGFDVVQQGRMVRRSIGVVGSGGWLGFDVQLPIRWNLKYWAVLYGCDPAEAEKKVDEVLSIVDLSSKAKESASILSSGMRQRLAIAKGLLTNARIFFMDEPTVALDPKTANNIREFIKHMKYQENATILLTTHNMQEAEELCDRIAILENGRIIACGTPASLKRQAARRVVHLEAIGLSAGIVQEFREKFCLKHSKYKAAGEAAYGWCDFHMNGSFMPFAEIRTFFAARNIDLAVLKETEASMEDVYLALTGKEMNSHAHAD